MKKIIKEVRLHVQVKGMEHVPNIFMSFNKYLFLEVINIGQKISESYLRTLVFSHIGFETKQEMKPYYNIVHKAFRAAILRKLRQFFSRWSNPCE